MVLKPKRQLWVPSKPAIIVPNRRPIPVVRLPIIPARHIIPVRGAVVLDATATADTVSPTLSTAASNNKLTVSAGLTNSAMVWGCVFGDGINTVAAPTSGTWASQTVNRIRTFGVAGAALALYGIVAPTSGNNTFSLTFASNVQCYLFGSSFSGVNQTGGTTTFANATDSSGQGTSFASVTQAITTAVGDYTVAVGMWGTSGTGDGFSAPAGSQVSIDVSDPNSTGVFFAMAQKATASGTSVSYTLNNGASTVDLCVLLGCDIVAAAAGAVVEEDNSKIPSRYWQGWTPNASLLRNTAQDFSSPGVETNPHWRPWTQPPQWNPLAALRQNAAVDVPPVVTPDTPPSFKPSSWPLQWSRDWRLFRTTAQDFSSFGVETNPHWIGRIWPVQWAPLSLLRATPNDAPAPIPPDTPPHWQSKPWPIQWNLLLALRQTPADDVPPVTPETNTFFTPRTFPLQWLLQPSLRQTTAQDFSFLGIATSVHLIPRTWPLQWSLQASLMRGTAQDFSTTPPATNPVYARYGAAHGIGMLSAIPGEIPS